MPNYRPSRESFVRWSAGASAIAVSAVLCLVPVSPASSVHTSPGPAATTAGTPETTLRAASAASAARGVTSDGTRARKGPEFGAIVHAMWGNQTWRERRRLMDKISNVGATWVRVGVQWSLIQPRRPSKGDSGYSLKWGVPRLDRTIRMAERRGLKVSITLMRTPGWANGNRPPIVLPDRPRDYAAVAEWLAKRYRGRVQSYEVWNEPNHPGHLSSGVRKYTRLLCKAYRGFHRGAPRTKVVFGGTAGSDWEYIRRSYRHGAKGCFDVMAIHPYSQDISPLTKPPNDKRWWFRNAPLAYRVMKRHGDGHKPVWFTETGWSTHKNTPSTPSEKRGVSKKKQAKYALQMLRFTKRNYPWVDRVAWYSARNQRTGDLENDNFGLFRRNLKPKPIVFSLRRYLRQ